MTTSRTTSLPKPITGEKISEGVLSYVKSRNRQQAYNMLVQAFRRSGLSQASLAKMVGMPTETISRVFSRPRNVELDTLSKLLFAISGATLAFEPVHFEERPSKMTSTVITLEACSSSQNEPTVSVRATSSSGAPQLINGVAA